MLTYIRNRFHPLKHLRSLSWFQKIQARIDRPVVIRCGRIRQHVLWLRDISYIVLREKIEERTARYFDAVVRGFAPDLLLDVGANIGAYSWQFLNLRAGSAAWLFEPDQANATLLQRTIEASALPNAELHRCAVSDSSGWVDFLVDDVSGKTGSIALNVAETGSPCPRPDSKLRRVECVALDTFMARMTGKRVLMKVDVEGAEDKVLGGARQILARIRPVVFIECFDLARISWVADCNYVLHDLGEAGNYLLIPGELCPATASGWLAPSGLPLWPVPLP